LLVFGLAFELGLTERLIGVLRLLPLLVEAALTEAGLSVAGKALAKH
jgi:hypothetical protein